ncbi:MAG: hypothetical protein WAU07_02670 [Microgenomates group bacterium]
MSNYLQTPEFRRASAETTQGVMRFSAKWLGIGFKAFVDFVIVIVKQIFGK